MSFALTRYYCFLSLLYFLLTVLCATFVVQFAGDTCQSLTTTTTNSNSSAPAALLRLLETAPNPTPPVDSTNKTTTNTTDTTKTNSSTTTTGSDTGNSTTVGNSTSKTVAENGTVSGMVMIPMVLCGIYAAELFFYSVSAACLGYISWSINIPSEFTKSKAGKIVGCCGFFMKCLPRFGRLLHVLVLIMLVAMVG